jgi:hypothetical protein
MKMCRFSTNEPLEMPFRTLFVEYRSHGNNYRLSWQAYTSTRSQRQLFFLNGARCKLPR